MYKMLVTTSTVLHGKATTVSTVALEFTSYMDAKAAIFKLNKAEDLEGTGLGRVVLPLFDTSPKIGQ